MNKFRARAGGLIHQSAARSAHITARNREAKVLKSGCLDQTVSKRSVLAPEAF